jgi:septal ring factor EnvC (AmiA/AmiB activator)
MSISELTAEMESKDSQIANLTSELDAAKQLATANAELTAELEAANLRAAKLEIQIGNFRDESTKKIEASNAELSTVKSELAESKKEAAQLRESSARFGAPAPKKTEQKQTPERPTMKLDQFNSLPISERNKFMREGGKLE